MLYGSTWTRWDEGLLAGQHVCLRLEAETQRCLFSTSVFVLFIWGHCSVILSNVQYSDTEETWCALTYKNWKRCSAALFLHRLKVFAHRRRRDALQSVSLIDKQWDKHVSNKYTLICSISVGLYDREYKTTISAGTLSGWMDRKQFW